VHSTIPGKKKYKYVILHADTQETERGGFSIVITFYRHINQPEFKKG
jgi:hypothetical protein